MKRKLSQEDIDLLSAYRALETAQSGISEFRQYMASTGLLDFKYAPAHHHKVLIQALESWAKTPNSRLMVWLPFGSGKSVYSSIILPVWLWARDPTAQLLAASNTQTFAESLSRRRRDAVETQEFQTISGTQLRADSKSIYEFQNTHGGIMRASGVGASVTGYRATHTILDDPHVNFEDLESQKYRDQIYEWYTRLFRSRLTPGGRELIISTRYHADDLCGRLIKLEGDDWVVLRIPEVCDDLSDPLGREIGERLWPEYLGEDRLLNQTRDPRLWLGAYQQKPPMDEGEWLDYHQLPVTSEPHGDIHKLVAVDLALTQGGGDYSVIITAGIDENQILWITDVWRKQAKPEETLDQLVAVCRDENPIWVLIENSPAEKVFRSMVMDAFKRYRIVVPLKEMPTGGKDKQIRAAAFQSLARQDRVRLKKAHWNADLINEAVEFPGGKHDDQIDCLALLGRHFPKIGGPPRPEKTQAPRIITSTQMINGQLYTQRTLDELFEDNSGGYRSLRI